MTGTSYKLMCAKNQGGMMARAAQFFVNTSV